MQIETQDNSAISVPWTEKYRPRDLSDLIANPHVSSTLRAYLDSNNLPNLLFYGSPGTGKTSTIIACAKQLYGTSYRYMVLELNASDDRGIQTVRKTIKQFAESKPPLQNQFIPFKLVILDEADAMTKDAQAALRRMIEKFSKTTRFCLICNHVV
jgi:replication factor C subunit 3/5